MTDKVLVWDPDGESEEHATEFEDESELTESDAEFYAIKYGEEDTDGQVDNIYEGGRLLKVKFPDGRTFDVTIYSEYEPTFYASKCEPV